MKIYIEWQGKLPTSKLYLLIKLSPKGRLGDSSPHPPAPSLKPSLAWAQRSETLQDRSAKWSEQEFPYLLWKYNWHNVILLWCITCTIIVPSVLYHRQWATVLFYCVFTSPLICNPIKTNTSTGSADRQLMMELQSILPSEDTGVRLTCSLWSSNQAWNVL